MLSCTRCCLSWRICCTAVRSRNGAQMGFACSCFSILPSTPSHSLAGAGGSLHPSRSVSPRLGCAPQVPDMFCFGHRASLSSTLRGEAGGVGHSTNNPREAGKLGQRCFLKRETYGGGPRAEAPVAVGEGGCTELIAASCAAQPPAPPFTGSSSPLPLAFPCTCLGRKPGSASQRSSQRG